MTGARSISLSWIIIFYQLLIYHSDKTWFPEVYRSSNALSFRKIFERCDGTQQLKVYSDQLYFTVVVTKLLVMTSKGVMSLFPVGHGGSTCMDMQLAGTGLSFHSWRWLERMR